MSDSYKHEFPHPVLTPFTGKPTPASLTVFYRELNANTISLPALRGNGLLGYLPLTVGAAAYTAAAGQAFVVPVHPGADPVLPLQATAAQITEATRVHAAAVKATTAYNSMEATLKAQIIAATPDIFIKALKHNAYSYAQVTAFQLITHLKTTYGTVTFQDLKANLLTMNSDWDTTQPTETLWAQLDDGQTFAAGLDDISNTTKTAAAISILERTGSFPEPLLRWNRRPIGEQTYTHLQVFIEEANKERLATSTTANAGYHGANLANGQAPAPGPGNGDIIHYCWTHGGGTDPNHNSANCRYRDPNHNPLATAGNMLGGNDRLKRRNGERGIPCQPRPPRVPP